MKNTRIILLLFFLLVYFSSCKKYAHIQNETTYSELSYQNLERSYLIHLPKSYDAKKKYPLIFVLHGITSRAKAIAGFSGFNKQSDQKDFIVCYPQGYKKSWGIQIDIGAAPRNEIDDVGFIDRLIDTLSYSYSVDTNQVFACGISNGGFMTALLASKIPDQLSGIALVCSNLFTPISDYDSTGSAIPLLLIAGVDDPLLQFDGGKVKGKNKYSTAGFWPTVNYWVAKNKCQYPVDSLVIDNDPNDKTKVIKYYSKTETAENGVVLYKIIHGGHAWPGRDNDFKSNFLGKISSEIDASEIITNFFLSAQK